MKVWYPFLCSSLSHSLIRFQLSLKSEPERSKFWSWLTIHYCSIPTALVTETTRGSSGRRRKQVCRQKEKNKTSSVIVVMEEPTRPPKPFHLQYRVRYYFRELTRILPNLTKRYVSWTLPVRSSEDGDPGVWTRVLSTHILTFTLPVGDSVWGPLVRRWSETGVDLSRQWSVLKYSFTFPRIRPQSEPRTTSRVGSRVGYVYFTPYVPLKVSDP